MAPRSQVAEALQAAFAATPEARWVWRAVVRLLALGEPVSIAQLARGMGWSLDRVRAALPPCERDEEGRIVGAGLSLRRGAHAVELRRRRLFAARTADLLVLPVLLERSFDARCSCAASGALIRLELTPSGLGGCEPAGAVALMPAAPEALPRARVEAHVFRGRSDAAAWSTLGLRGAVLPLKEAFRIGAEIGASFAGYEERGSGAAAGE